MTTTTIEPPEDPDDLTELESDWALWLYSLFPSYINKPMAPFHVDFWDWAWAIQPMIRPDPRINLWFRAGGKTTHAELFTVAIGSRNIRKYAVYIKESQDRADDAVSNISTMLESRQFAARYPQMANRALTRYGKAKGWRRNRLHTASGFVVDALGLDVASRGLKVDEKRPDLAILDDLDSDTDTADIIERKISTITRRILPALHPHAAILGIQNLVHANSIFSKLHKGTAGFLSDAEISGPFPALEDFAYETKIRDGRPRIEITGGTPTWPVVGRKECQEQIDTIGITAFLSEMQHVVLEATGNMFDTVVFRRCTRDEVPQLDRLTLWLDPAGTSTDSSDCCAIQVDGIDRTQTLYRLFSWEKRADPYDALKKSLRIALEYGVPHVGIETNFGADLWGSSFVNARRELGPEFAHITMKTAKADSSTGNKAHRAAAGMLVSYEKGEIVHVQGTHDVLEQALLRFPLIKPFDLVDAAVWSHDHLKRYMRPATAVAATGRIGGSFPVRRGGATLGIPDENSALSGIAGRKGLRIVKK